MVKTIKIGNYILTYNQRGFSIWTTWKGKKHRHFIDGSLLFDKDVTYSSGTIMLNQVNKDIPHFKQIKEGIFDFELKIPKRKIKKVV